ncbi:hypothetical protein [Streptomyces longwoodensis]|uniref:hypothetical protein n=1 Tax=Streptomyces longwoodensis TaxID=68231 RepID=UPI002257F683|nr:hypothetical protein [Streptomyces longwoodensis]MCX4995458.1 hypothetical protein [Streptomyces longwoodensis]
MLRPTAPPRAAALRVARTAVGRHALRVLLLVGGLFALGLLFGGQAQAAEGPQDTGSRPVAEPAPNGAGPAGETASATDPAAAGTTPPTGRVVRIVGEGVVRPVGHVVRSVTEGLGRVQAQLPPVSSSPSLPTLPSLPSLPALPTLPSLPWLPSVPSEPTLPELPQLPQLPQLPGLPGVPGPSDGSGGFEPPVTTLPAPVDELPQQGATPVTPAPQQHAPEQGRAAAATTMPIDPAHAPTRAHGTSYGPWDAPRQSAGDRPAHGVAHHGGARPSPPAPAQHAPGGGHSDGVLGNAPAMDNGAPRHGDAHAVTPHHPVTLRLVTGGALGAEATETRDRYRDIPVFPA